MLFSSQANMVYVGGVNIAEDANLYNSPCSILIKEMYELKTEKILPDLELRKQESMCTL